MSSQGRSVGIISLEMTQEEITDRLTSLRSKVNLLKFRSGRFTAENWQGIVDAQEQLHSERIEIDDKPGRPWNFHIHSKEHEFSFNICVISCFLSCEAKMRKCILEGIKLHIHI